MTTKEFHDELTKSLAAIQKYSSHDELAQLDVTLRQLSLFSRQTNPADCEQIISALQNSIKKLSVEVSSEEHELQAETNGGQMFTPDDLERLNEYAYRHELMQCLQHVLDVIYEVRPEFKPK